DLVAASIRHGLDLADVQAVLITHLHDDHVDPTTLYWRAPGFAVPPLPEALVVGTGPSLRRLHDRNGVPLNPDSTRLRMHAATLGERIEVATGGIQSADPRAKPERTRIPSGVPTTGPARRYEVVVVPASHAGPHLSRTKPLRTASHLPELRAAEARLARNGHRPFSIWQLLGVGSVGSQSLTAIPVMHQVRTHPLLETRCAVWPFETGLCLPSQPDIVIAEVWPSSLDRTVIDAEPYPVKDARQVSALAHLLAAEQGAGSLAAWFEPGNGDDLDRAAIVAEEGWTLGVG
ncbi:MAG: hypothetical protein RJB61_2167, partial [Actinomycetota bacterium]